ncbi:MAG TPA: hypothetical protein VJ182_00735 [Anaerolineales bacterium]|nr:hypothetical protein [Anaerolineales bacterium]
MRDGTRACLGFVFLAAALVLAVLFGIGGWVLGGDAGSGLTVGLVTFAIFAAAAATMFITIKDYAWIPAVLGGIYAILPDLLIGPADDAVVLVSGVLISGLISWRRGRRASEG